MLAHGYTTGASRKYTNKYKYIGEITPPGELLPLSTYITAPEVLHVLQLKYPTYKLSELLDNDRRMRPYFTPAAKAKAKDLLDNRHFHDPNDTYEMNDDQRAFWARNDQRN